MALTYTWKIEKLTKTTQDAVEDVIIHVRWVLTGTDENGLQGSFSGATPLKFDSSAEGFVPYTNLTKEDVVSWLEGIVVGSYWDHVTEQIQKQINKQTAVEEEVDEANLPWAEVVEVAEDPAAEPEVSGSEE